MQLGCRFTEKYDRKDTNHTLIQLWFISKDIKSLNDLRIINIFL
jgi:hypothetical protein